MQNKEILEQLQEQNNEIYLNTLSIDIDKNLENLNLTFQNYLNNLHFIMLNTILEFEDGTLNKNKISENLEIFIESILKELQKENINRKDYLYKNIKFSKIEEYRNTLKNQNKNIINNLQTSYDLLVEKLYNIIAENYNQFQSDRLKDYLYKTNKNKLIEKINEIYINTDNILLNNYENLLIKYDNLKSITIK